MDINMDVYQTLPLPKHLHARAKEFPLRHRTISFLRRCVLVFMLLPPILPRGIIYLRDTNKLHVSIENGTCIISIAGLPGQGVP